MKTNYRKESRSHERSQSNSLLNCDNFESEPKWPLHFTLSMNFLAHVVVANIPIDFTASLYVRHAMYAMGPA